MLVSSLVGVTHYELSFIFSVGVAKEYNTRENAYNCFDSNSHKSYFRSCKDVTEESCYHRATLVETILHLK